jgi:hypothetical protein
MKRSFKNITITLEENLARWARIEAARSETSVSGFLANLLKERMARKDDYEAAKRRSLARKPFLNTDGRYLSREQAHDRDNLR